MKSRFALQPYAPHIPALFEQAVSHNPDRIWIAQRRGPARDWRKVSYAEGKQGVDALTQGLLNLKLPPGSPVAILSGNSIEHAMLTLAAMQARLPVAPISPSYSQSTTDFARLRYVFDLIRPAALFVQSGIQFEEALTALSPRGIPVIYVEEGPTGFVGLNFYDLATTTMTSEVNASINAVGADTVAKLLLTSGSTGLPKAVINTHRMMCANVAMSQQCRHRRPGQVLLDWMPWNHTMGGNMMFHSTIADRGTLYIDDGRPPPGPFDETLRNLKEISPSYFANVPIAYSALVSAMENDDELARSFFKNLELLTYGGAALSDDLYFRMQQLAVRWTGQRIVFYTGWGSTETAPSAASTYWDNEEVGLVGLPHPGIELKLVPTDDKYELRLRGITVTPGYYNQPDLTASAFDDEGYYRIGDAGRFVDPEDPAAGIRFAGRVVEDFKLSSGTFVHVGGLRVEIIASTSPLVQDLVIAGQDQPFVAILAWVNLGACRQLMNRPEAELKDVAADPEVISRITHGLAVHNGKNRGSSRRVGRAILLAEPPSIASGEINDKGYINQRAVLARRAEVVERLYAANPGGDIIVLV